MNNKSIFKWFSMLLLMTIVGMSGATAQSLVIDGFSIKAGETKDVAIQLAADQIPIYGVQTDIVLSQGLLLEAKASAVEGLSFVSNTVSSGAVRVSLLSIAGNTIPEGNVINLTVKTSEAFTRGYIQLTNTRLTTSDTGDELKVADVSAAVTLDENGETEYEEVANGTIALEYSQSGFVENFGTLYTPDRMHVGFNDLAITNGSLLSFNGTKEFQGTDGSAISMATIINSSDVKLPVEVNDDNTLSLVWSLKEGYIFEPSKLSFEACRFGTDSGLLTASINCGNQQQVLCEAADVMRSGKGEITKFSFDIYNLVVTSSNSLCLNFSFLSLGMNKEMGLANIVIEGKLLKSTDVITEPDPQTYTATFSTNRGWENVYAYMWSNGVDGSVTEFLGEWPGMQIGAGDGTYTLSIEATAAPQYIIFNNGQGGEGNQTEDLAFENGKAYEFNVAVENVLPIDIQFGPDYNQESIGSYTTTWTAVKDGYEWTLSGFNNNKNVWNYVKCGQAKVDQTATITSPVINAEVKSYIINVDNTRNVNSATLTILSSDGKVMEMDITESFTTGEVVVPVEGQKGDSYVLTINSIAGANGTTQISKITLSDKDVTPVHIANTAETAYTVAKAIELVDAAQALSDTVYVKGIVSQVDPFNEQYDNITYWISDDGTTDGQQFECYRGKGLNGAGFTSANDVKVGATVIVKGTMQKYGYTYEFVAGNELVSYTAPEDPFVITSREKPVPASQEFVEGQTYYLYNVGADMFFAAGNDYSTRASVAEEGQQVYFVFNEEMGCYELKNYVPKFAEFRSAFADGPESVWTDNDTRETRFWNLQQVDDNYRISNTNIEPDFFLGWRGEEADTRLYLMDSQDVNVSWKLVSLNDYEIYAYLLQVYNVAEQLKAKIEQAQGMGLDVTSEQAVYDNLSSTIDEMQECINSLADRMANNASGKNPVDVTAKYIVNPSYDANDANGWSGTKPYSQRYQNAEFYNKTFDMYQDLSRLAPGVYKLGLQAYYRPGYIDNAYESWKSASNLFAEMYVEQFGEREIQPVMNTLDGSVTEKLGIGSEASVNDNGTLRYVPNDMQSANTYFNAGLYQNNLFFVVNETGDVRIGLSKYELIQSDWTMFDNWTLTYYGNGDDSYLAWVQAVADAAPTFEGVTVTQSVLNEYLAVRNAPVANSKEEAEAYVNQLEALKAAVMENSALWTQYETLVAEGQKLANQLQEEGKTNSQEYENLNDYVTASFGPGEYENYARNGSASYIIGSLAMDNATLEAEMAYLNELMDAAKYLAPQEGDDVTRYLVNADFSEGQTGWMGWKSATSGGNAGRSPITGGSPNICAEAYDANNFDLYQEVTGNVNVGVYEISVQGFTRIGRNDGSTKGVAWNQFRETDGKQKMPVYVYFNDNATNFKDIHEEPQTTDFYSGLNTYDVDILSNEGYYSQFEYDEELCFPNTFTGASYAFARDLYVNSAFGAVVHQGDPIRVGIKGSTNGQNWAAFDNVKLTFWGKQADKVLLALQAGIADVEALNAGRVGKNVVERIANALAVAKNAAEEQSNDGEAMFATLGELYAAKAAVQASQELMNQLAAANNSLQDAVAAANLTRLLRNANAFRQEIATRLNNNDINDDEVVDLIAEIHEWMFDISRFVELQEWVDRLNEAQPTNQEIADGSVSVKWIQEWETLATELDVMLNPETEEEAVKVEQVDDLIEQIIQMIDTKYEVEAVLGDANNDGQVTMSDVVAIVNYVLGRSNANFNFYNADVNGTGDVTMADVVGVVNIVLGRAVTRARGAGQTTLVPGTLTLKAEADRMSVKLDNTTAYTAFQMDVTLPEGMSLNDVAYAGRQTSSHSLMMSELENGKVRIAGWSANNAELKGNSGELLSLVLEGAQTVGTVTIDNIRFVTAEGVEHAFAAVETFGETTGMGLTPALSEGEGVVYDLQGRKVNTQLKKGLYILDGKKSVKK